ncbi:MAG: aconitase family protein [Vampirovibrionales bacterium]
MPATTMPDRSKTLYEKIWDAHVIEQVTDGPSVLYIDRHLIHEVTSPQAFAGLAQRGVGVRRPDKTSATVDHSLPTTPATNPLPMPKPKTRLKPCAKTVRPIG